MQMVPGTDSSLCILIVPIMASDRVLGSIIFENFEREDAFGTPCIRLLQTVASSMGVALENARLFDERGERAARRGACHHQQRAGIARRRARASRASTMRSAKRSARSSSRRRRHPRRTTRARHWSTTRSVRKRPAHPDRVPSPAGDRLLRHVLHTSRRSLVNEDMQPSEQLGSACSRQRWYEVGGLVPLISGDQVRGMVQIADCERRTRSPSRTCACCRRSPAA
jgi:GAF domain-containing protein